MNIVDYASNPRAMELVCDILSKQHRHRLLSRGPDYVPNDKQLEWEESLLCAIRDEIADYRYRMMKGYGPFECSINQDAFRQAETLNIDRERVSRIIMAAKADFDWDDAVGDMMNRGMEREDAEEVTQRIALGISARRSRDHDVRDAIRQKVEARLMITGSVVFVLAAVIVWIYWSWLSDTVHTMYQYLLNVCAG